LIAAALLAVLAVSAIFLMPVLFAEKVETLMELNFDDENDIKYISGYQDGQIEVSEGVMNVLFGGCNLEYRPANNMLAHFRVQVSGQGAFGLSQYRINNSLGFECIYHDDEQNVDMTTSNKQMSGTPIVNNGEWLDIILYTNAQNSAVYAVVCDNESGNITYAAYQVPKMFNNEDFYTLYDGTFFVEILAFYESDSDYMKIDYINISEGSLRQYLNENMAAYTKHKQRVDAFLAQDVSELPEMVFKPAEQE